jgi:hypothetical protein
LIREIQAKMDKTIIIFGAAAILGCIGYILYRMSNRPNQEFFRYYDEVLSSDKYRVKGKYED